MMANLFPAILLAGPPNCGKSVLSFLLTYGLRERGVSHYLLRAVPDGEGDWFLSGTSEVVQTLRTGHKTRYSSQFVEHMQGAIERRFLPLLVDIGGRPQGEQFGIIRACTNSILLHRTDDELLEWRKNLEDSQLLPIAELRSSLTGEDSVQQHEPHLRGNITGLEREPKRRKIGAVFNALLERVAGVCSYDAAALEQIHFEQAPFPTVNERELAGNLSVPVDGERMTWSPKHLALLSDLVPASQPLAIYGRGPVWLASFLAARSLPASFAIFDARYGWLHPPPVHFRQTDANLDVSALPYQGEDVWLEIGIQGGTLEPGDIIMNPILDKEGIVLSGKIPRWLFATLAHQLAPDHDWIAVDDPRLDQAILVYSKVSSHRPGDTLPRLAK
jgi:CRISPR-associated protein Csx3